MASRMLRTMSKYLALLYPRRICRSTSSSPLWWVGGRSIPGQVRSGTVRSGQVRSSQVTWKGTLKLGMRAGLLATALITLGDMYLSIQVVGQVRVRSGQVYD